LPVKSAHAIESYSPHYYLIIPDKENSHKDLIIDPTYSMFLKGRSGIFIGSRAELRNLVFQSEIINTRYLDDPQRVFKEFWGDESKIYY
jgi:hypothetical protein